MPKTILKITLALIFWGIFLFVVFKIPYPESLTQGRLTQIAPFFIFLFLSITSTLNIFFKNILMSFSIALCFSFILILQALDSLNIVTGILIVISAGLLFSYFKKTKKHYPSTSLRGREPSGRTGSGLKNLNPIKSDLTKQTKIPKLTRWRK